MWNLFLHELKTRRNAMIGWGLGLAFYSFVIVTLYTQLPPELRNLDIGSIALYKALGITSMATFEGFATAELLNLMPMIFGIYAIITGTNALVGEEEDGTLELVVSLPIPRWQIVLTKALAIITSLLVIAVLNGLGGVIGFQMILSQITTEVTAVKFFLGLLNLWPIAIYFALLALCLGAIFPNRRSVYAVVTVWLIFSYLGNNLAALYEPLQTIQPLLPFHYLDVSATALTEGVYWGDAAVLIATAAAFALLGIVSFQKRNLTVGAWPWQRPQIPQ